MTPILTGDSGKKAQQKGGKHTIPHQDIGLLLSHLAVPIAEKAKKTGAHPAYP